MKPSSLNRILLALAILLSATAVTAQSDIALNALVRAPFLHADEMNATTGPKVNSKVMESFNKIFRNANDPQWFVIDEKFQVRFSRNGQKNRAVFDTKGIMVYSVAELTENDLPLDMRHAMREEYAECRIKHAFEVRSMGTVAWVAKLEDASSLFSVTFTDGMLTQTDHFWKSR